uniref:RUN domain-containing protein n=2 Tax=Pectinophora gossypiella TaxID=13191 RepID=A0A1E1WU34_PECGO
MIALVWCIVSKILEIAKTAHCKDEIESEKVIVKHVRRPKKRNRKRRRPKGPPPRLGLKAPSPAVDEDCNSNTSLAGSQHSAHDDLDAHCDNSGYLWFLDYNPIFRDGSCHHQSVLSSVSASYKGISELASRFEFTSRYNDLARDLDANLAEADMESFKTEDIHALLMTANMPHDTIIDDRTHDGEESVGSINTMSICKSELLFSPVKEGIHGVHFSVDSLDCELPTEQELILTCQANKDNYTIAFEGSLTTYSEDSECVELAVNHKHDKLGKEEENVTLDNDERTRRNLELLERCKKLTNKLTTSMARSDLGLTTWSKLKKQTNHSPLRRHPSGNNNEDSNDSTDATNDMNNSVIKSQSLPNLYRKKLMSSSINSAALSNSTVDSFTVNQRLHGTPTCMKVYDVSQHRSHGSQHSEPMSTSSTENHTSSDKSQPKQPFNLVKLFMKQKSMSNDGIVSMDQLDRSECWPSSSGGESGESIGEQKMTDSKTERPQAELPNKVLEEVTTVVYEEIPTNPYNRVYDEVLVEEEETVDGAKLIDSETPLYATVNKPHLKKHNLNVTNSPSKVRSNKKSYSSQSSATSVSISSCSESDGTQITRMNRLRQKEPCENKTTSTHIEAVTIDKSMQTSIMQVSSRTAEREIFKVVEPSFLEKLKEGDCQKPVFVLYPSYTLPDISFLNGRPNIYLNPVKVNISSKASESKRNRLQVKGKRPFSCNDLEMLKKKGLGHIKDWDSLNFLLPMECKQLLSEMPELMQHMKDKEAKCSEKYCTPSKSKNRPMSCDCNNLGNNTAVSSSSSTATQPSSGYRGSSTMLTDSSAQNSPAPAGNFNPLFVYRYDSATSSEASCVNNDGHRSNPTVPRRSLSLADQTRLAKQGEQVPPRPPLPKSILRKSMDKTRKSSSKRYSMFEMDDLLQDPIICMTAATEHKTKRRSLQEPYYLQNQNVDYRKNNDLAAKRLSQQFLDAAEKDADYNEYYQDEGVGTESSLESGKSNELKYHRPHTPPLPKPRTKKIEYTEFPPPGALISSADLQQLEEFLKLSGFNCQNMDDWDQNQVQKAKNLAEIPICEEAEVSPDEFGSPIHHDGRGKYDLIDVSQKRALVSNVTDAVEMMIQHFSSATDQTELAFLGDSKQSPACAKIALNALCPALYAIFRDGLKENIETSFGAVNNSVWQMVESTARQGPITKSLNELVLRINSEDAVTEGLVKFNAFILGLLNAQSVDAWVSYVRTRESVLAKHYGPDSIVLAGCVGEPRCRALLDTLLASLEPLKLLPFSLDLMFEMRELHRSFKKIESDMRAASRLDTSGEEPWRPGSAGSCASNNTGKDSNASGGKFRRLQLKWELLSNAESPTGTPSGETSPATARGSKIPRPVSSPMRPQAPTLQSPAKNTHRGIPVPVRKGQSPTTSTPRPTTARNAATKRPPQPANRTSRVDQAHGPAGAAPRPSSLPYGRSVPPAAPRRAASSSAARAHHSSNQQKHKYVRTLWHRLPSDSGHLAFNEGERLRLILEVDDQYLLCCRGEQKGLVPRDAVLLEDF